MEAYRKFSNAEGFSRIIDIKEVAANDYNLNVTLYVMPIEEKEHIDILKEFYELRELEKERQEIGKKIEEYIGELRKVLK